MPSFRRLLPCLALLLGACASPPPPPSPVTRGDYASVQQQLQAYISQQLDAQKVAGLSIALVDDQKLVAAWGAGWADVASGKPANEHTLYRMGSISKLFTDTAAMQLVAKEQLALDAPIQQALPWFRIAGPSDGPPITLRRLMTHHSGLPRDTAGGMWLNAAPASAQDFRAMLRGLTDEPRAAPAGQAFGYSNVALDAVGAAVEAASGRPFEAQLQAAVLQPLGMHEARFSAAVPSHPAMATGHLRRQAQAEPALRDVPAGTLVASVQDMARFLSMQFAQGRNAQGQEVLPQAQWAEMLRVQNAAVALDGDLKVGLGWMFTTFGMDTVKGGGPVAHHGGATFYFRSQLMMLPQQRLGVIVAANDGNAGALVNRLAQRALALLLEAKTGARQPAPVPGFQPAVQPWPQAQRQATQGACVGDYATVAGPVSIRADGAALSAHLGRAEQTLELREGEHGRLGLRYRVLGLLPVSLGPLGALGLSCERSSGRDLLWGVVDEQRMLVGERLPPAAPLPAAAQFWVGHYQPRLAAGEVASASAVNVHITAGRLWVDYRLHPAFGGQLQSAILRPESSTQARLIGPLADTGPVITLDARPGQSASIRFSGWVFDRQGP